MQQSPPKFMINLGLPNSTKSTDKWQNPSSHGRGVSSIDRNGGGGAGGVGAVNQNDLSVITEMQYSHGESMMKEYIKSFNNM